MLRSLFALGILGSLCAVGVIYSSGLQLEPADFTFNNGTEVSTLDPATVTGVPEGRIIRAIFEGLVVKHPKTLEPLPGMAESWEISEDRLTYTFHIRKNAVWTNGDPVTARDFTFSFERFLNPKTAAEYSYQLSSYVAGAKEYVTDLDSNGNPRRSFDTVAIKATDDHTLEIGLAQPTPYFLELCAFYPLFPVNRRNLETAMEKWPGEEWRYEWLKPENIVTNGPYRVAFRRVNDRIRLVKFEHYWDADNVAMRTIDALAIENDATTQNVYLTGVAHWVDRCVSKFAPQLVDREDFSPQPYLGAYFYRVNVTRAPFDDPRVRQALALAIPRQEIIDEILKLPFIPAYGLVPPGMRGYTPAECEHHDQCEHGPECPNGPKCADYSHARELLKEAGFGAGGRTFPTMEIHYNNNEQHQAIAEKLQKTWRRELGIEVRMLNEEWKVYLDTQSNLGYDVSRAGWIGDYADPNTFLDLFVTGGENNKTGWGNHRYDELIGLAKLEPDPKTRMRHFFDAETILMRELPILPIYFYIDRNLVAPRLGGWEDNLQDEHFPKFFYWMDDEELAAKRAAYDRDPPPEIVRTYGPPEGLYSPAEQRRRAARKGN